MKSRPLADAWPTVLGKQSWGQSAEGKLTGKPLYSQVASSRGNCVLF